MSHLVHDRNGKISRRDWLCLGGLAVLAPAAAPRAEAGAAAVPRRRIFASGGAISAGSDYPLLRYLLALTAKAEPVVCCLPTARGDHLENLVAWYEMMNTLPCRPRHLRLFGPTAALRDFEKQLLSADVVFVPGGNTLNMLAVWKAQEVDKVLRTAWERGIVLAGESAGMVCWFEQAISDSRPERLTAMDCLGWLKGSAAAHYHHPQQPRKPRYHELLASGELKDGIACDDGAAILFEGDDLAKVVTTSPQATAYRVHRLAGRVLEEPLKAEHLGAKP